MEVGEIARAVRKNYVLLVGVVLVSLAVAGAITLLQPTRYQAMAKAFVSTSSASNISDLTQGNTFTQQVVKSYADVATTPFVLNSVIKSLGLRDTASELADRVSATAPLDTVIIEITADDHSARRAAQLANAVSSRLQSAVIELSPTSAGSPNGSVKITQIQAASVPSVPSSPNAMLNLVLGLLLGVVAGLVAAILRSRLDTRVHTVRDVQGLLGHPVLGGIMFDHDAPTAPLIMKRAAHSSRAEAIRSLRTSLQYLEFSGACKKIVVTSSVSSEGKSTSAANLAIAMVEAGQRVLLIDADLRRPALASYFSIDGSIGLTDVLIGAVQLDDAVQHWGEDGLMVLPSGNLPPNPSELLQGAGMVQLMSALSDRFDVILFDSPPVLPVADASILSGEVDGAIIVVGAGRVRRAELAATERKLSQVNARILGVLVTMLPARGLDAYAYGSYSYQPDESR